MADMTEADRDEALLARVAWLYYNDGLTQSEVGKLLSIPRIKVSRLLEAGRTSGLVQLRINSRQQGCLELEARVRQQFGLSDCRVIPESTSEDINMRVGQAAAQYLMQKLQPGDSLSVGWGETVTHSIRMLGYTAQERGIGLYSLTGGVRTYVEGMREANWHRNVNIIPAPLVLSTPELAQALTQEPSVSSLISKALEADYKLVGIGGLSETATVVTQGYLAPSEIDPLRRSGARGDILCHFYDRNGQDISLPLHDRVVGVNLEQLRQSEKVIAAAGGPTKTGPILSALRGEIIDILVTDEPTALALLDALEG
ncbi:sugar-binding transcriptional regulator [Celeribacter halophilus]|uniref:sugar-binding transcriptional regulator n=1 Tax=Celeribacter halophilus TaxID=576117 RepID=UPI003A8F3C5F